MFRVFDLLEYLILIICITLIIFSAESGSSSECNAYVSATILIHGTREKVRGVTGYPSAVTGAERFTSAGDGRITSNAFQARRKR